MRPNCRNCDAEMTILEHVMINERRGVEKLVWVCPKAGDEHPRRETIVRIGSYP